mmetsp:Transcript_2437/g.3637  ORF Transcript_2437/g.3637 Transcript_2437/m.3637 type:complete len:1052 (-) Transcript_2437:248-3403(-)|eukprot:CAMPEP_0195520886 /NCGR_PEP_ID=MMETSP0794_2-20130614/17600_1 /TAXON_ID=515487 /ORGANISM="Stephanopyxis turris, Strain CCMP 815" /LENGTH=1051 /DNA_ID=CAMNT_0040650323 /DNA_START=69 /DNA_END=3224 /DNA_ORIENTATION=+
MPPSDSATLADPPTNGLQAATLPIDDILKSYSVQDPKEGLPTSVIQSLRDKHGWNELDKEESASLFKLILDQFDDTLVQILLVAAVVSFGLALWDEDSDEGIAGFVEPIVILVILILNAMVGVWQESNAEAALEALKDLQPEHARVLRSGKMQTIATKEVVPGDIVEVRVGDRVPADMRLLELKTTSLRVDQAQLTGESQSVSKDVETLKLTENVIQSKTNMLFATTVVVNGNARGIVMQTGMKTEIGKIQSAVQEAGKEEDSTPLKKKLDEFGDMLSWVIGVVCVLVWLINYQHFFDPVHGSVAKGCIYYFKIAVALAVAAIPEGLPTVITTCLAMGTRKMAKKNAIVRKLPSVETLGCTNVICSDKTGTLTTNEMSCIEMVLPTASESTIVKHTISGITYSPEGTITPAPATDSVQITTMASIMSLCNDSAIEYNTDAHKYTRVGEPTEAALKVLVEKLGLPNAFDQAALQTKRNTDKAQTAHAVNDHWHNQSTILSTLEFSRDRKSMSVLTSSKSKPSDPNQLLVKGAPEGLIDRCSHVLLSNGSIAPLTSLGKKALLTEVEDMSSRALRCLALAYKVCDGELSTYDGTRSHPGREILSRSSSTFHEIESNLVFSGLVGMLDPPRDEIAPMVKTCRMAGIRIIMITGDNQLTANAIAYKTGILTSNDESYLKERSMTGAQFFSMSEEKQMAFLSKGGGGLVFSRTEPKHKQSLVALLKKQRCVVAMTGDGVNDAPALKLADIGIAMGITGTEVAKEASDMILADDNFATIVAAVEEGRAIYNNMQAFIRYLISSNIGEVAAIFFTAALGMPEGLIPVQLLWVNLVTDGPPATALGFNPADADIMKKLPRCADDNLITAWVFFRYMVVGIYVGFACVAVFAYWYMYHESDDNHTLISWYQLTNWQKCSEWENFKVNDFDGWDMQTDPCKYFTEGKETASTLSLSVLVAIEMFNALNALSEDGSLLTMPPWANPYLIVAMLVSFGMHFVILYVEPLANTFSVTPLDKSEWMLVMVFSLPVILIDEVLKAIGRHLHGKELEKRMQLEKKSQ